MTLAATKVVTIPVIAVLAMAATYFLNDPPSAVLLAQSWSIVSTASPAHHDTPSSPSRLGVAETEFGGGSCSSASPLFTPGIVVATPRRGGMPRAIDAVPRLSVIVHPR
ncbi:hypothetical protein ORI20_14535 [Mycobacterium sp. CVI_P3]|uniref:Secreted protein n=1 Tax=Mycobacterium pinniadriaticum TaxID=2994102 RepID=A0ABT3SEH6_9MYCO|nr:hypothetical protein [Mycobacterium pinniadriaticum]MCX2931497.1 hypothetical protein [Mycobacterium pinniadriaticum]MCX2937921.1 hypothetical protein [Mycobacterium pinniadriaticum]